MKKVRLTSYDKPDPKSIRSKDKRCYKLWLPGGVEYYGQEKELIARLGQVNRALNLQLQDLNRLVAEVYSEFRFYRLNLDNQETAEVAQTFIAIDKAITLMIDRTSYFGNAYAFQRFKFILGSLDDILTILEGLKINASLGQMRYRLRSLRSRVEFIRLNLAGISENSVTK